MGLASRRVLASRLRAKQRKIALVRPNMFAANRIVKHLTTSHSHGKKVKTATVFYDKQNAVLGRALEKEFRKKRVKTQALGLIGSDSVSGKGYLKSLRKPARAEAVVFLASDMKQKYEDLHNFLIKSAEDRRKTFRGTRFADIYGMNNTRMRRVLTLDSLSLINMRKFTGKTFEALQGSREIKVSTSNGTNVVFILSPRIKWAKDNGILSKNYWGNLPAGEVFTAPMSVNGRIVIDGFSFGLGNLANNPITVLVKNGRAILSSVKCTNLKIKQKFIQQLLKDKNSSRIGELGFGTNVGIKKEHGSILIDEKIPGIHIAFGDPLSGDTKARWKSDQHNDSIITKPTVIVDGRKIMQKGKSLLK
ncbi:MAG: aminopeptidase [archaeon]